MIWVFIGFIASYVVMERLLVAQIKRARSETERLREENSRLRKLVDYYRECAI